MEWVSNKCGGARFRTLPDYRIEIEGSGVPAYAPGSPEHRQLVQTWKNWKRLIRKHARKSGIPPSYLLAIATKETGLWSDDKREQASVGSPAGAQGVMQVMPCHIFTKEPYKSLVCQSDRTDPDDSFKIGSTLLANHLRRYGFPAAASAYNAGELYCYTGPTSNPGVRPNQFGWKNEHDYATKATTFNNTAVLMGVNKSSVWPWLVGGLVVSGSLVGLLHTKVLRLPRPLR